MFISKRCYRDKTINRGVMLHVINMFEIARWTYLNESTGNLEIKNCFEKMFLLFHINGSLLTLLSTNRPFFCESNFFLIFLKNISAMYVSKIYILRPNINLLDSQVKIIWNCSEIFIVKYLNIHFTIECNWRWLSGIQEINELQILLNSESHFYSILTKSLNILVEQIKLKLKK